MSKVAIPTPDEAVQLRALFAGNPVIVAAADALTAFGADLSATAAAALLPMWRSFGDLTEREARAVVALFVPDFGSDPEHGSSDLGGPLAGEWRDAGLGLLERRARQGETCTCGRPARKVYRTTDTGGEVGYCGIPDGGAR